MIAKNMNKIPLPSKQTVDYDEEDYDEEDDY
jgi:hypothetical protein